MTDPRAEPACLLAPLRERYDDVLGRIEELVNVDSGSFTTTGVNRVADLCQARFEAGGWEVERHRHRPDQEWAGAPLGDLVVGRRAGEHGVDAQAAHHRRQRQADVVDPDPGPAVEQGADRQHLALVVEDGLDDPGRGQPDRVVGGPLAADDLPGGPDHPADDLVAGGRVQRRPAGHVPGQQRHRPDGGAAPQRDLRVAVLEIGRAHV